MIRKIFLFAFALSLFLCIFANAGSPEDDYISFIAKGFQLGIVEKLKVHCSNYTEFCESQGGDESSINSCKIWTRNFVCKNATDPEGLKNTVKEIKRSRSNSI